MSTASGISDLLPPGAHACGRVGDAASLGVLDDCSRLACQAWWYFLSVILAGMGAWSRPSGTGDRPAPRPQHSPRDSGGPGWNGQLGAQSVKRQTGSGISRDAHYEWSPRGRRSQRLEQAALAPNVMQAWLGAAQ